VATSSGSWNECRGTRRYPSPNPTCAVRGENAPDAHSTTFSVANVALHQLSVAVEAGDAGAPPRLAADPAHRAAVAGAPACRREHHELDQARAQLWTGRRERAPDHLERADRLGPQLIRCRPVARATLRRIIEAERAPAAQGLRRLVGSFRLLRPVGQRSAGPAGCRPRGRPGRAPRISWQVRASSA
jgi:hypothetical protein